MRAATSSSPRAVRVLSGVVTRHPRVVLGVWAVLVVSLAFVGRNLERELSLTPLYISGTQSARAHEIGLREFGNDSSMVVMLRGPKAAVERQGKNLAERLDAMPRVLVVSPWARGAKIEGLEPRPGVSTLVVRVAGRQSDGVQGQLAPVQAAVDRLIRAPVQANVAGLPVIIESLNHAGEDATKLGEMIAIPILLVILLFVFRSVLAALTPVVVGGAVVAATRGILSVLHHFIQLDLLVIGVVGMIGLALGVDYSLLVVSRFREELDSRGEVSEAVRATIEATIRSIVPAGCGLVLAMLIAPLLFSGSSPRTIAIGVSLATLLSMVSALCIVPAWLCVVGRNLDRWALRIAPRNRPGLLAIPRRLSQRPRVVGSIIVFLALLSGLAFSLKSGVASVAFLPSGDKGRAQQEAVQDELGPGWLAPMEVLVAGRGSPVTTPSRLHAMAAFQHRVEADPGVQTMAGLARLYQGTRKLVGVEDELEKQEHGLVRLENGVDRLRNGLEGGTAGLRRAAAGSQGLAAGLGAAHAGAGALAEALVLTGNGSSRLSGALGQAGAGSGKLAEGTSKASHGAGLIAEALSKAQEKTHEALGGTRLLNSALRSGNQRLGNLHAPLSATEEQLLVALEALRSMDAGKADPQYLTALRALESAGRHLTGGDLGAEEGDESPAGVGAGVEGAEGQFEVGLYLAGRMADSGRQANRGIKKLADASAQLDDGLERLADGTRKLADGVGAIARGGQRLSPFLQRIGTGAQRLTAGLGLLDKGAGRLADGLDQGASQSGTLSTALDKAAAGFSKGKGSDIAGMRRQSPGLFRSAYFVLAGLDGSGAARREQIGTLLNLNRGGTDARMLVVPTDAPTSEGARQTKDRLEEQAAQLARETGTEVVVGGVAPSQIDLNDAFRSQSVLMRIALAFVSLLILIPLLRSLTIPLLAALVNLLTVSASFGLLALLFNTSLLGGPGFVDSSMVPATIMVMFGLAIDYEVFVFARIREEYVRTGSTEVAVARGLDRTAHIIGGAALIMIVVFLSFSASDFMTIRNFGVSQAIAVFIDAFIVRLIIVPAMFGWLGRWSWWMPKLLGGGGRSATADPSG